MIKRMGVFAAVFLLTLYCFFLYDDEILAAMLVVELVYVLIALPLLYVMRRSLKISMAQVLPIAEKNQEIPVRIQVRNVSRIPMIHFQIRIQVENTFTSERKTYYMTGVVGGRKMETMVLTLQEKNCGNLRITMDQCKIYDVLFLFRNTLKTKESQYVGILPECHLLPVEVTRRTREFLADAEEYSDRESGDDPSDIYQIREYREKDSIHDIHWKLSAKAEDLLVKEHGRPLGCVVLIWLNLEQPDGKKRKETGGTMGKKHWNRKHSVSDEMLTVLLEAVASLSLSLLEEKCVHMVAWYEPENQRIRKKRISREEHIYELLNRLLYVKPYSDKEAVQNQYEEAFQTVTFSTTVEFRMYGTVWVNQEERMRLPDQEKDVKWEELYFTV